jgi:hypothetical protein
MVLKERPKVPNSESPAEYIDHGEELTGVYTPGCSSLEEARMMKEQAKRLRNRGIAGGSATDSVAGSQKT